MKQALCAVFRGIKEEAADLRPNGIVYVTLGLLSFMLLSKYIIAVPVIVQMLVYTVPIIYLGSMFSLNVKAAPNTTGQAPQVEVISKTDALLFPLIASATLVLM
ncbi:putative signal peptide peptidase domain protein [Gregarina niphandrodes]|uniref:Signal peptide peptidase domain protein n=1 Tax=Gregarina niphandrodes TaxID=110365 RepID=A0A023AYC2_GRENI|nr:putative signal peptide peptidase domain protein [Gregarina niphandrodes]EZG43656.1 putative signal peptide peptidase domain protein [Gregarina niphandrodes]|eukprot:XP_011133110.1 putative signal peptide peptidase domain protein [Gregarina niphandrodes]